MKVIYLIKKIERAINKCIFEKKYKNSIISHKFMRDINFNDEVFFLINIIQYLCFFPCLINNLLSKYQIYYFK